jgi:3-oxoisoapionate decarboxylase
MDRRNFLLSFSAATTSSLWSRPLADPFESAAAPRTTMGVALYSFAFRHPKSALEFLDYCHSLGAGGVQTELDSFEADYLKKLRQRAEELGMYLEAIVELPDKTPEHFERVVRAAKEAGAVCLRAACLSGRRYEAFSTLAEWKFFVADSKARVRSALPVLEKYRIPLGIENHKDWTLEELLALVKECDSEYLGACIDTGNNIALLDDPMELVAGLAPYAVTTHIKDMAVEEYQEGFLLSEVPLGHGLLDVKKIIESIAKERPKTKLSLEMITRNPLKVPCLTDKYWRTFPDRSGRYLARALTLVRASKPRQPLVWLDGLDAGSMLKLEEQNVKECLDYARERLGLTLF